MITVTHLDDLKLDNNYRYFDSARSVIAHSDGQAQISLHLREDGIQAHIVPSAPEFRQEIIDGLLALHRLMGLKIIFSKSLKISRTISYSVIFVA